jgi:GNAT superfamily N-acetyltransferase
VAIDVAITKFTREDEADAVKMLVEKLPPSEREGAYETRLRRWRWQYYENPNNPEGEPLIWVARVDGRFGGMVATIPVKLRTPAGYMLGTWGVDFIVDPATRGLGIGKKLLEAWTPCPDVSFVLGWSPVSFRVAVGLGFRVIWGFTNATLVLARGSFGLHLLKAKRRRDLLRFARVFLRGIPGVALSSLPVDVTNTVPDGAEELWRQVAGSYSFCVERDLPYLDWRYVSHPGHKYHFVRAGGSGLPAGIAVCRLTEDSPPLGVISDLIVDPDRHDIVLALLDATVGFLKSRGAYAVSLDLSPALAPQVLERFPCSLSQPLGMIVHTEDKAVEEAGIFSHGRWYISRSDADQDY